ncbi:MAG TPA: hypothetical protein VGM17_10625 [Rhizomicrobium sp.]|jgi:hypothetical protein
METRRTILGGLMAAGVPAVSLHAADVQKPLPPAGLMPDGQVHANLVPGPKPDDPPILDFGDGLRVPMGKQALKVLWEGKDFWLTYGTGNARITLLAIAAANHSAEGTMKLMLLTLAFRPERLEKINGCGWRLKSGDVKDLVLGDIDLPGQPAFPITSTASGKLAHGMDALFGGTRDFDAGVNNDIHALTAYIVKKKDVSLDDVRTNAHLL